MNSALQVFCHLPNIRDYFLYGQYERDKVTYELNSYISDEFQNVIYNLSMCNQTSFSPDSFKNKTREYIELLDHYKQQDSADFLIQLLELIHNELTGQKVSKTGKFKKSLNNQWRCWDQKQSESECEKENIQVDNSIISQNIHGKYSRTMLCESCEDHSTSEDDFTVVSLHIPSNKKVTVHLKFYPVKLIDGSIMIDYELMFESDQSLISEVLSKLKLCKSEEIYYEYYKTSDSDQELVSISKHNPIKEIGEINFSKLRCIVHLYELKCQEENSDYYDFKLCIGEEDNTKTLDQNSVFKIPVNKDTTLFYFHQYVFYYLIFRPRKGDNKVFDKYFNKLAQKRETRHYRIDYIIKSNQINKARSQNLQLINEVGIDKDITFKEFIESLQNKKVSFKIIRFIPAEDNMITLENNKLPSSCIEIKSKYELTLESCLSKFVVDEVYSDYNCDKCGKVTNCIMKTKMSLLPKYLIIQLMRFESVYTATKTILTKNDNFVSFPIKDLDLSDIYKNDLSPTSCIYDLCGVIHHSESIKCYHYNQRKNNLNKILLIIFIIYIYNFLNVCFLYNNLNLTILIMVEILTNTILIIYRVAYIKCEKNNLSRKT